MPSGKVSTLLLLSALVLTWSGHLPILAAPAPAPAPAPEPLAISANITGSLGNLCSSQPGVLSLVQGSAANQDRAGLAIAVPASLTNAVAVQQIAQIAWEYIYSFPIPFVAKTLALGSANGTAVNTFYLRSNRLATSNDTAVVAPNHDTIYSQGWLDLSQGPVILTLPSFDSNRYWIVPLQDAYTNTYSVLGSDYNTQAGQYLIVGRNVSVNATFRGFTPDRIIHAPTDINLIIARVQVMSNADTAAASSLNQAITLAAYSTSANATSSTMSKATTIARAVNGSGYGTTSTLLQYVTNLSQQPAAWFNLSATFVGIDPPGMGASSVDTTLAALSTTAGNATGLAATAFGVGSQVALRCITTSDVGLDTKTGWNITNGAGSYGKDYLLRAQIARSGLGALPASQSIYATTTRDSQNRTLDASTGNNYTVTFPLPLPARAFWSLTLYNAPTMALVNNTINRYSIGDNTSGLSLSGAGNNTLQVFISASQPARQSPQYANWLPAPINAPFELILRLYEAESDVFSGQYAPPAVVRATDQASTITSK
uniref:Putative extracellular protein TR9_078 n=1 Tax=Trebouxia lynnae TaxID=1825957 RepID=A0A7L9QEP1_9CHLO|nr:putative extracellular protein TR9_078 [Trebouxia lynnae]